MSHNHCPVSNPKQLPMPASAAAAAASPSDPLAICCTEQLGSECSGGGGGTLTGHQTRPAPALPCKCLEFCAIGTEPAFRSFRTLYFFEILERNTRTSASSGYTVVCLASLCVRLLYCTLPATSIEQFNRLR
eukprot:scpid101317/ scgid35551/ 